MKGSSLPPGYVLGVLNREQAAQYVGVSPSLFDELVANGRMPKGVVLSERRFGWVQRELDGAIATLPRKGETETDGARVGEMSDGERDALEDFDAARKAAKAQKSSAQY
jgi:predicted DNA-binding transcriptional regulator AlpA